MMLLMMSTWSTRRWVVAALAALGTAMARQSSWAGPAKAYLDLYRKALKARQER